MTRQYWANMVFCIVVGALVIFSVTKIGSALTPKGLFASDPKPSPEAEKILKDVVLTKFQLGEGLNNMVEADFYIQNKTDNNIKNVNVLCEFFDEKGMYRDRETWILAETIPAMHVLKISSISKRYVNTGARALNCSITDFQLVRKPAFTLERHESKGHGESSVSGHGEQPPSGH